MALKLLNKITVKDVCGKTKAPLEGESLDLMVVTGIVARVSAGNTNYGDFVKLHGQFHAKNLVTGDEFRSGSCILPDVINDMIHGQFAAMEPGSSVQFGVKISVDQDDSVIIGYKYSAEPLIDAAESDPLEALLTTVNAALPAPDKKPSGK